MKEAGTAIAVSSVPSTIATSLASPAAVSCMGGGSSIDGASKAARSMAPAPDPDAAVLKAVAACDTPSSISVSATTLPRRACRACPDACSAIVGLQSGVARFAFQLAARELAHRKPPPWRQRKKCGAAAYQSS